jgi:hypothetical protein
MKISLSRLIIGLIFSIAGVFFIILSTFTSWWMLFYGIPLIILGIVILLNKSEDNIEKRKDLKEKRYNK